MKDEFKTGCVVMSSRIKAVTTEKFMNLSFGKFLTEKINQLWCKNRPKQMGQVSI